MADLGSMRAQNVHVATQAPSDDPQQSKCGAHGCVSARDIPNLTRNRAVKGPQTDQPPPDHSPPGPTGYR